MTRQKNNKSKCMGFLDTQCSWLQEAGWGWMIPQYRADVGRIGSAVFGSLLKQARDRVRCLNSK